MYQLINSALEASWWDWIRAVNILAGGYVFFKMLVARQIKWKHIYSVREKRIWHGLMGANITLLLASVENIAQNNPGGARVILTLVATTFMVLAVRTPEDLNHRPIIINRGDC